LSNFESVLVHKSGEEIQIEMSSSLTTWKGVQAQIVSFRDVYERKKYELELVEAKRKAEESDRLKSAFLANMSHEIRTPMNGILGFTSLLMEPDLTGEQQQNYIEIIRESGDRMLNTVNDIIEISKIETGQISISFKKVNINEQLEYLCNFFKPEIEEKGLELKIIEKLPADQSTIMTDVLKINSILTNLIKNAIKYSKTGSIHLSCKQHDNHLLFTIKDNGIGIPQNRIDAIFDRFVQADITDKRAYEGSGLGLAITKSYVEMLGGEIWVESVQGNGSTFYFTIDYLMAETQSPFLKLKDKGAQNGAEESLILVAEDEDVGFLLIESFLSNENYKLMRAKNGREAVEMVRKNNDISLVLMDLKMPEMDGLEATEKIREFNTDISIIAQTAYALEGDKAKALNAGCNGYISKPIHRQELIAGIEKLLRQ